MKKLNLTSIFILILCAFQMQGQTENTFYVSPEGTDTNPGTIEAPFLSISRAQEEVQKFNRKARGDIQVFLREGTYRLNEPLVFNQLDGGSKDHKVIYSGFENEQVIVSGGTEITDWEIKEDGIWVARFTGDYFRQLYVNGERRTRARHPNTGEYFRVKGFVFKHDELLLDRSEIKNWPGFEGIEMILQMHWAECLLRLKSLSTQGTVTTRTVNAEINPEDAEIFFSRPYPSHFYDQSYHLENNIAFLDVKGEWFFDRESSMIYYKPFENEKPENVTVTIPQLENLLKITGTADKPVSNLIFEGITFAYSNWKRPGNKPYFNLQAGLFNKSADSNNIQYVIRPEAAIQVTWAKNVILRDNILENMGSTAIDLYYGTNECQVIGNIVRNISGGGIMAGKFVENADAEIHLPYNPSDKREVSTNDIIANNFITRTGQDYYGSCAIAAGYPAGIKILHNTIRNVPYTGISVGYGWTGEDNAMHDNIIAHNDIGRAMSFMSDGAGIYTLSKQPGTIIKNNYIHDFIRSPWASPWPVAAIYLDEQSGGTEEKPLIVEKNVVDLKDAIYLKLNHAGIFLYKPNYLRGISSDEAKKIVSAAGLESEYMPLLKK